MPDAKKKSDWEKYKSQLRPFMGWFDNYKNLIGCEVGVQRGVNAQVMLEIYDIKTLYLIDAYRVYPVTTREHGTSVAWDEESTSETHTTIWGEARDNLLKYQDCVRWLIGWSFDMAQHIPDGVLDFVYIDGDHSYEGCLEDIRLFYPKVRSGGMIAGHDYGRENNGVEEAVRSYFGREFEKGVMRKGQDWWYQKKDSFASRWGMTLEEFNEQQGMAKTK